MLSLIISTFELRVLLVDHPLKNNEKALVFLMEGAAAQLRYQFFDKNQRRRAAAAAGDTRA